MEECSLFAQEKRHLIGYTTGQVHLAQGSFELDMGIVAEDAQRCRL